MCRPEVKAWLTDGCFECDSFLTKTLGVGFSFKMSLTLLMSGVAGFEPTRNLSYGASPW